MGNFLGKDRSTEMDMKTISGSYDPRPQEKILLKDTEESYPLFNKFYCSPTQENLDSILKAESSWKKLGELYLFFNLKARSKWKLKPPLSKDEQKTLEEMEIFLLSEESKLTVTHLDILWALLRATGEDSYPLRVKEIISSENQCSAVRATAQYSYIMHIRMGILFDGEYLLRWIMGAEEDLTGHKI